MKYKILAALALTFTCVSVILAQSPGGPPPPVAGPIDGGALLLLGAGAAYGVKRMKEAKAKKAE